MCCHQYHKFLYKASQNLPPNGQNQLKIQITLIKIRLQPNDAIMDLSKLKIQTCSIHLFISQVQ
jgi:hypothetical protein